MTGSLPHDDLAATWRAARDAPAVRHLDSAACSRTSRAVREAVARHAALESEIGGYTAAAAAAPLIDAARSAIAGLVGMTGDSGGAGNIAFTESAMASLAALLDSWPLPEGGRVLVGRGEYGEGVGLLARKGLDVVAPDPDEIADAIRNEPPALVHITHLASYRGRTQPLTEIAAACAQTNVPLWVDAAQSFGHLDCALGAAVVYGTSRKWLAGPRGVGFVAVDPGWHAVLRPPWVPGGDSVVRGLESSEAHVAGRVGLAAALKEHLAAGPARVRERLCAVGTLTRATLDGAGGWSVADAPDDPSAIVGLAPPPAVDVGETRARLLRDHAILTTVADPVRSPLDPEATGALLRVSPHVDVTTDDLDALATALEGKGRRAGVADTA